MLHLDGSGDRFEASRDLQVSLGPIASLEALGGLWLDLERRSVCSFFQTWAWVGCWLRHLPSGLAPQVLSVSIGSQVVGLGVLVFRHETRHRILVADTFHLNQTGDPHIDTLALEYNGLLIDRRIAKSSAESCCLRWLVENEDSWDEWHLDGLELATSEAWVRAAREFDLLNRVRAKKRCDYVDLMVVRQSEGGYLGSLSRNTRYQIRRAMRLYDSSGPLSIVAAREPTEAAQFLDDLRELHQASWCRRGHRGAFADGFFDRFHRDLVEAQFNSGMIQLLGIWAGTRIVGYLYNFVKDGRVYAYQSGFNYDDDPRFKPGLVSHCLAIQHYASQGAKIYDFMAGNSRYKRNLGTDFVEMIWLTLQRPRPSLRIENGLRSVRQRIAGHAELD